jgi:hypothetical protein
MASGPTLKESAGWESMRGQRKKLSRAAEKLWIFFHIHTCNALEIGNRMAQQIQRATERDGSVKVPGSPMPNPQNTLETNLSRSKYSAPPYRPDSMIRAAFGIGFSHKSNLLLNIPSSGQAVHDGS